MGFVWGWLVDGCGSDGWMGCSGLVVEGLLLVLIAYVGCCNAPVPKTARFFPSPWAVWLSPEFPPYSEGRRI